MICLNCNKSGISIAVLYCPECAASLSSFPILKPGTKLKGGLSSNDAYTIEYAIGRGGFGITYRAWDNMNNRKVAIKELLPIDYATRAYGEPEVQISHNNAHIHKRISESFIREGNCLSGLRANNHIVKFIDFFEENGTLYLVMEYIDGCSLEHKLGNAPGKRFSENYVLKIGSQLVSTLAYAHQNGVYHCDLSPRNIMIKKDDSVVLIDFGSARYEYRINSHLAINDYYSPIELLAHREDIRNNSASDIFMLAMILYEMLTGELPPSALERCGKQRKEFFADKLKEPFKSTIEKALKLNIEDRPDDITEWWSTIDIYFTIKKCCNIKCKRFGKLQINKNHIYCTQCGQPLINSK